MDKISTFLSTTEHFLHNLASIFTANLRFGVFAARDKHMRSRHAVPAHQLAGRLYAVAHRAERFRIFTQFRRQLREQQFVPLDGNSRVRPESLGTVSRKALNLFQAVARNASHGAEVVHLTIQ